MRLSGWLSEHALVFRCLTIACLPGTAYHGADHTTCFLDIAIMLLVSVSLLLFATGVCCVCNMLCARLAA